jgi:acetyl esterase/lipase
MRTFITALALVLLGCASATAQTARSPEQVYKAAGAKASPPIATVPYGADPLQVADLRLPAGSGPYPVAIVVHGGCWRASVDNRAGIAAFADALGKRGFATWNIEYRRVGDKGGGWPGTFEDVAAGVDKLAQVAAEHHLDMSRVVIVGHSAGAHLALWAASRPRLPAPWSKVAVRPVAVVAIDGPAALAPFVGIDAEVCGGPVIVPLMGGTPQERPKEYALASPADHLPLGLRQLSVEGELGDLMQPYNAAVGASSDSIEVLRPPGANHFDIVTPGTRNGEAVADFIAQKALAVGAPKR